MLRLCFQLRLATLAFRKQSSLGFANIITCKQVNELFDFARSFLCGKLLGSLVLHRKEVIQPLVLERLPCYDFTPIANPTFGSSLLAVRILTSGITGSHGVTGGVYKARERIHRDMLIRDY